MKHKIIKSSCIGCGACSVRCPQEAIVRDGDVYKIDEDKCVGCGECEDICPVGAIK